MPTIQLSYQEDENGDFDFNTFVLKLKSLLSKKFKLFWNIRNFEKYLESDPNPWGLRIQIFPNIEKTTNEFKNVWEANLNRCSANMISILNAHYKQEIKTTDQTISKLYADNSDLISNAKFLEKEKSMNVSLEKLHRNVVGGKEKKFNRDKLAFATNRAYTWKRRPFNNKRQMPHFERKEDRYLKYESSDTFPDVSNISSRSKKDSHKEKFKNQAPTNKDQSHKT